MLLVAGGGLGWLFAPAALGLAVGAWLGARRLWAVIAAGAIALLGWSWTAVAFSGARLASLAPPAYLVTNLSSSYLEKFLQSVMGAAAAARANPLFVVASIAIACALAWAAWPLKRALGESREWVVGALAVVAVCVTVCVGAWQPAVVENFKTIPPGSATDAGIYRAAYGRMLAGEGYYEAFLHAAEKDDRLIAEKAIRNGKFYSFISAPAQMRSAVRVLRVALSGSHRSHRACSCWGLHACAALLLLLYWACCPTRATPRRSPSSSLPRCSSRPWCGWASSTRICGPGFAALAALLLWLRGKYIAAGVAALLAGLFREPALIVLVIFAGWSAFYAFKSRKREWVIRTATMAGLLVAFAGLFWLHSVKASAYIASGTSASGGIIVTMLQAGQKLGWDGKLAAVSFLGVLWWIAGVAPVAMLLLQLPGWGWTLWRRKIAFWPVMTLAVFWVAFIVIVGPYSSYWGLMFMPIAYAGTGASIAKLGSEGVGGVGVTGSVTA